MLASSVTLVTRLCLDAALYTPAPPYSGCGRPRKQGKRLPTLRALLSTDPDILPEQIVAWFVRRWSIEVTLEEARRHLGVETQLQWSDWAILRSTPALLGLFSWVTLVAHHFHQTQPLPVQRAAWYAKPLPTFAHALA